MEQIRDELFIRKMVLACCTAFLIIGLLAFISFLVLSQNIKREAASSAIVSMSGQQHMLSQRIALLCLSLLSTKDEQLQERLASQIGELADQLAQIHSKLLRGGGFGHSASELPESIRQAYFGLPFELDKKITRFVDETRALISLPLSQLQIDDPHLKYVTSASTDLLHDLAELTARYRIEGESGIKRLQETELVVFLATLVVLLATGIAIFYPMIKRLSLELKERSSQAVELKSMADALKERGAALERSNQALDQFASIVAHDLRAPLRNVSNFAELLSKNSRAQDESRDQEYLGFIGNAIKRMDRLVLDLLSYSRITSKKQNFEKLDLAEVVQEVLLDLKASIAKYSAEIELGKLPVIEADRTQIRQLLQNLIQNALKFHHPQRAPRLRIYGEPASLDSRPAVRIIVEDNGIGFEPSQAQRIFQIFKRLHTEEQYEGTGIGLAICRRVIESHNGEISATGIPDQGTTIVATLPEKQNVAI